MGFRLVPLNGALFAPPIQIGVFLGDIFRANHSNTIVVFGSIGLSSFIIILLRSSSWVCFPQVSCVTLLRGSNRLSLKLERAG